MKTGKRGFYFLITLLLVATWMGCGLDKQLTGPAGSAQVSLNIQFAQSVAKQNFGHNIDNATRIIREVTVSVLEAGSNAVVIKEQRLDIVLIDGNRFAEGELSIPVRDESQPFIIVVFASDPDNLFFFVGTANVTLESGETHEQVDIILQLATSIASGGTVNASSTFPQQGFEPTSAIDLNPGTSWFSGGASVDGSSSTFTWTARQQVFLGTIGIFNNERHTNTIYQTRFGFRTVTFQVYDGPDASGTMLYEETVDYPKTFPVVRVAPFVSGRSIRLLLNEHENPDCGGFSELLVVAFDLSTGEPVKTLLAIDLSPLNPTIDVGKTAQFQATGRYSDASTSDITNEVTWGISDTTVATINSAGLATGAGPGTATIGATQGAISGEATLTVNAPQLQSIAISPQNPTTEVGQTQPFTATGTFSDNSTSDITNQVTWASNDQNVATINSAGLATGVGPGTATISATQGAISDQTTLTVNAVQLSGATLSNLQVPLVQLNDATNCTLADQRVASLFNIVFNYTDPDGDVTTGTTALVTFTFSPSNTTGSFRVTSPGITGDGAQGTITLGICLVFSDDTSVRVTVSITDAGNRVSNATSVAIQKPEGANSPPGRQHFRKGDIKSTCTVSSKF